MKCEEIFEALSEYIDEEITIQKCREIEAHLEHCSNCRIVVDTLKKTVALYHAIPAENVPDEVRLRLHKVIRLENGES